MNSLHDLVHERACVALLHRYCWLIDSGNASQVALLFTTSGTWILGKSKVSGTAALRGSFAVREAATERTTRHVLTNLVIEIDPGSADGPSSATGRGYLTAYRHDAQVRGSDPAPLPGPVMVGDMHAEFVCRDGIWLINTLRTSPSFLRRDDSVSARS